jgi:hypothetical protein
MEQSLFDTKQTPPKQIRYTLLGRAIFEFHSYLFGPLRQYFSNKDYLDGLADQKQASLLRFSRATWRIMILSILLTLYVSGVKFDFSIAGKQLVQLPSIIEVVMFLAAGALMQSVTTFLDYMIVDRLLNTLTTHELKITSPAYAYAHKNSLGIWADVLSIRMSGYRSGRAHIAVALFVVAYGILTLAAMYGFCLWSIVYAFFFLYQSQSFTSPTFEIIAWIAMAGAGFAVALLILTFLVRFEFTLKEMPNTNEE